MPVADFSDLTEQWGMRMPDVQIRMASVRYSFAAEHAQERDCLEVGCGSGFGLELIARRAKRVVGGDLTESNLRSARKHSPQRPLARFDAQRLPFADASFDVVVMFEVIYYVNDIREALREVRRVLRSHGEVLVCLPNRERPGFHESPLSCSYPSASELRGMLSEAGFDVEVFAGFRIGESGIVDQILVAGSTIGRRLHLIPDSLTGRGRIKRLLYGTLKPLHGLSEVQSSKELVAIDTEQQVRDFKNLYAVGRLERSK
jgi:SAM-dependent methyltransferase